MNARLLLPLLATSALALACGPRSHSDLSSRTAAVQHGIKEDTGLARAAARARRAGHEGELARTLVVDTTGAGVRFAFAIENAGNKTIELHFQDGQTHDILVVDSAGREVWNWARGRLFTQAHRTETVAGGGVVRLEERWDAPAAPGRYTAIAKLRSTNFPIEQRVEFVLE